LENRKTDRDKETDMEVKLFKTIRCSPKECEFFDVGTHLVAVAERGGEIYCAFLEVGLHTEESLKDIIEIPMHSIIPV
jgi:hypothetical protein